MEEKEMSLKQALKLKNLLISEIAELYNLIRNNNQVISGNSRDYSPSELILMLDSKILHLTSLKSKIQKANYPVLEKIYMLSELKNKIQSFKSIPVEQGKIRNSYRGDVEPEIMEVELGSKQIRELIKGYEAEVLNIQDELDTFNAITMI